MLRYETTYGVLKMIPQSNNLNLKDIILRIINVRWVGLHALEKHPKNCRGLEQELHDRISIFQHTLKNNLINFSNVNEKDYVKIKRGLKKSFKTIPCLNDDRSVFETFDVVYADYKIPITYYKTKTIQIQEDASKGSKKVIEIIQNILNL